MSDEPKYEGFSLKSSKKSKNITVKNPSIDIDGTLDHATRKLGTREISSEGLKKVQEKTAKVMKIKDDISTNKKRKNIYGIDGIIYKCKNIYYNFASILSL